MAGIHAGHSFVGFGIDMRARPKLIKESGSLPVFVVIDGEANIGLQMFFRIIRVGGNFFGSLNVLRIGVLLRSTESAFP
ncbi:MAG: hypothetical protein ACI9LO_001076 [Planctomycetota bacterium]|jgi:hypothetical protein